jgi:hypothetical protein
MLCALVGSAIDPLYPPPLGNATAAATGTAETLFVNGACDGKGTGVGVALPEGALGATPPPHAATAMAANTKTAQEKRRHRMYG